MKNEDIPWLVRFPLSYDVVQVTLTGREVEKPKKKKLKQVCYKGGVKKYVYEKE